MFRILISDKLGKAGLDLLGQMTDVSYEMKLNMSKAELLAAIPDYDALIVRSETQVDAELLAAGTRLKVVGRAGMGVDNIDVAAAEAHLERAGEVCEGPADYRGVMGVLRTAFSGSES